MRSTAYAYPWDVTDARSADMIAELGTDSVTLAAAYHAVRAATPRHPTRRIIGSDRTRLFVPHRAEAWRGSTYAPGRGADVTEAADSFGVARELLAERGLPVRAWAVLTHVDRLDVPAALLRRNALGEVFDYAACPANAEVREYAATLLREVLHGSGVADVVLEAVGPMGIDHASLHDKTASPILPPAMRSALSFCFCDGCLASLHLRSVDGETLQAGLRDGILSDDVAALEQRLSDPAIHAHRAAVADTASAQAIGAAVEAGASSVWLHASAEQGDGGPSVAVGSALADPVAAAAGAAELGFIASCWGPAEISAQRVAALRRSAPSRGIGAYVTILGGEESNGAAALAESWRTLEEAGAQELHLYHAGLAPQPALAVARQTLALLH